MNLLLKSLQNNSNWVRKAKNEIKCIPCNGEIQDEEQRNGGKAKTWLY